MRKIAYEGWNYYHHRKYRECTSWAEARKYVIGKGIDHKVVYRSSDNRKIYVEDGLEVIERLKVNSEVFVVSENGGIEDKGPKCLLSPEMEQTIKNALEERATFKVMEWAVPF